MCCILSLHVLWCHAWGDYFILRKYHLMNPSAAHKLSSLRAAANCGYVNCAVFRLLCFVLITVDDYSLAGGQAPAHHMMLGVNGW